jgi:hypothetical protein
MKKKGLIIASLLVLVMSFVFLGCPDDKEEPDAWLLTDAAKAALKNIGIEDLATPGAGSFVGHGTGTDSDGKFVILGWSGCDGAKATAYKTKLTASISIARNIDYDDDYYFNNLNIDGHYGIIYLSSGDGGTQNGLTVPGNSIVLQIWE